MAALIVALLGALLLVGSSEATTAGGMRQLAVVSLEGADQVAFVDLARGRVLRRLAVALGPHNLDATGDGRIVAVTSPPSGRLTILDGRRLRVLRVVSGLGSPHDVKLSADGRTAYVLEEATGGSPSSIPARAVCSAAWRPVPARTTSRSAISPGSRTARAMRR
jgi:DNA-binding beta-propeller fold protein YncE